MGFQMNLKDVQNSLAENQQQITKDNYMAQTKFASFQALILGS